MRPEPAAAGTLVPSDVEVAVVTPPAVTLKRALLFAGMGSKPVPLIVSGVPATAIDGVNPVMAGAPEAPAPTVKAPALAAEPAGAVTEIGPVVAPEGTVATMSVDVLEVTDAGVPLKRTVFWVGVALNPVPRIRTVAPTGPLPGEKSMTATWLDGCRPMASRLPTAS